jgi:hypothetical protein
MMSKGDRDKRGRRGSGKLCPDSQSGGCVYCRTGEYKGINRAKDKREARKEAVNDD